MAQQRRPRVCREHHRLDRKCMSMAAPGSDRCALHHLEAFTQQRALNRRRRLCGCGAQPDPGYRTCAWCRVWSSWRKRCQRNPALRLDYRTIRFVAGYCDHGNAARAAREAGLGEGSGARRKGISATPEASYPRCHRGPERRCRQPRSSASRGRCASGGTHPRSRARPPGAVGADRLARSRGSRAQAKATHAAAS